MSLQHFYLEGQVLAEEEGERIPLRLPPEDARHFKVLRLKAGEHIAVIDAARDYFECEITDANWDAPCVRICTHQRADEIDMGPRVLLVQGLAKGDKLDTVVRQAVEVGVDGIVMVPFARSVVTCGDLRRQRKPERWEAIAKSAAMQSGRQQIPDTVLLDSLDELAGPLGGATAVLVFWEEAPRDATIAHAIQDALNADLITPADARIVVVVGPEGGMESSEVERLLGMARRHRGYTVTLGDTILRTETAGVVAPALVLYELRR